MFQLNNVCRLLFIFKNDCLIHCWPNELNGIYLKAYTSFAHISIRGRGTRRYFERKVNRIIVLIEGKSENLAQSPRLERAGIKRKVFDSNTSFCGQHANTPFAQDI